MKQYFTAVILVLLVLGAFELNGQQQEGLTGQAVEMRIGSSGQYQTIQSAFTSLAQTGTTVAVNLIIMSDYNPALETFPIRITKIAGSSSFNYVKLKVDSLVKNLVLRSTNPIFLFDSVANVMITGKNLNALPSERLSLANYNSNGKVVVFNSSNDNLYLDNLNLYTTGINSFGNGIVSIEGGRNDLNIRYCTIKDIDSSRVLHNTASIGIKSSCQLLDALYIENNEISNFGKAAIYIETRNRNLAIYNNNIYTDSAWYGSELYGIYVDSGYAGRISKNKIYSLKNKKPGSSITGIKIKGDGSYNYSTTGSFILSANFVSLAENYESNYYAIDCENDYYTSINNNTVFVKGNNDSLFSINIRAKNSRELSIKNNIISNKRLGQEYKQINISFNNCQIYDVKYNAYFNNRTHMFLGRFNDTFCPTLTNWRYYIGGDYYSVLVNTEFNSDIDLHLANSSIGNVNLRCVPPSFPLETDIDEDEWGFPYSYIGADEVLGHPLPVDLKTFQISDNNKAIKLDWETASEINNYGFEIERSLDKELWVRIAFVKGHNTTTTPTKYTYNDAPGIDGKYYYRLKQIDFAGVFEYSQILSIDFIEPVEFGLTQNYPNPFNPSTKLTYALYEKGFVTLKVYNILGKEVKTLVSGVEEKGKHEVTFDGSGLAGGVYFYTLSEGSKQVTKKMILLK